MATKNEICLEHYSKRPCAQCASDLAAAPGLMLYSSAEAKGSLTTQLVKEISSILCHIPRQLMPAMRNFAWTVTPEEFEILCDENMPAESRGGVEALYILGMRVLPQ